MNLKTKCLLKDIHIKILHEFTKAQSKVNAISFLSCVNEPLREQSIFQTGENIVVVNSVSNNKKACEVPYV